MIPYPVLGLEGAFNDECNVDVSIESRITISKYEFDVKMSISDETILTLIDKGKAAFACEIDCSKTFYRSVFTSKKNVMSIEIPRTSLLGEVNFFFSVVLLSDIVDYQNPNMNRRYYDGYKFNLSKGSLLAYFGERTFNADIKYDELKAVGTIVEVKEEPNENYTYYDFAGDKIRIFLPTDEFKNFNRSNNNLLADITHASIVQCALTSALHAYKDHKNTLWAQTLKMRTITQRNLKCFEDLEELDSRQISHMVSILLDNANKRMFAKLDLLRENEI
jgi:hypothetical protein